ncbi:MAG TPA: sigma-70 family RNA polymerase sigma factor [Steroidobacteraceae bacterium]|nr:sigma-70 family RNA polymerase sigma factor [Steroidobacteraceae bacterium]
MILPLPAGDPSATDVVEPPVAALAAAYGRQVFHTAHRLLGNASQAEDVQQDVFLRLLEHPPAQVASWPAYLSAMATRLSIDRLRRGTRWRRLLPIWVASARQDEDSAELPALQAQQAARLRTAMGRLKPREATCFSLRYLQGFEIPQIATSLGMSANHVSVCLHRAQRALQAELGDRRCFNEESRS